MSGDSYLADYDKSVSNVASGGIGGVLRGRLDARARSAGQTDRHALFLPRALELCGLSLDRRLTVVEIGAGNGWALSYQHPNLERIAMDLGPYYKAELERHGIAFFQVDASQSELPVAPQSVDMIMINHVIEHISQYEFFVAQMKRALRPGGAAYIRTPNIDRVKWHFFDDFTHVKAFNPRGLDQMMRTSGFTRKVLFYSDHQRISMDILTGSKLRSQLFSKTFGGAEIEAVYASNGL